MKSELLIATEYFIDTPHLMSIPPKESELQKERDFNEWLKSQKKKLITVCCPNTVRILTKALEIGLTETDLHLFKNSFHKHPLTRFSGSRFRVDKKIEVEMDNLIDEIFDTADLFSSQKLSIFYLESIYDEVQQENKNPIWTKEVLKFNRLFPKRRDKAKNNFIENLENQLPSQVKESLVL